jgi:hypothetical protein
MRISGLKPSVASQQEITSPGQAIRLGTASPEDVMLDQLQYLVGHKKNHSCPPRCPECARLKRVKRSLLQPFRSVLCQRAGTPRDPA